MKRNISKSTFVRQGGIPGQLRVHNETKWYVIQETWEGRQILDTRILRSFNDEASARKYAAKING
jgi:hypothetical protein